MRISAGKTIDFLEAAYDASGDTDTWRAAVLEAAMAIVGGESGAWFDFDAHVDDENAFRLNTLTKRVLRGEHVREPSANGEAWRELPPQILESLFGRSLAMTFGRDT